MSEAKEPGTRGEFNVSRFERIVVIRGFGTSESVFAIQNLVAIGGSIRTEEGASLCVQNLGRKSGSAFGAAVTCILMEEASKITPVCEY